MYVITEYAKLPKAVIVSIGVFKADGTGRLNNSSDACFAGLKMESVSLLDVQILEMTKTKQACFTFDQAIMFFFFQPFAN